MKKLIIAALVMCAFLSFIASAQDKVKYCKNATTGQIITVEVGMPCPFPTHEL
jgi:hypothetical protein